jgi:UPF0716 family protein affecting phage T7 exclusion
MLRRLLSVLCVLVTVDLLMLVVMSYFVDWRLPLGESIVMVVVGLAVLTHYQSRWSKAIAESLDADCLHAASDRHCVEELLLLVAGILLLVPGALGDVVGLLLLVPWVRRRTARNLWPHP